MEEINNGILVGAAIGDCTGGDGRALDDEYALYEYPPMLLM